MSDLRTAAQQALKVLEAGTDVDPILAGEAEEALRSALAQQAEPRNQCGETCERAKLCATCAQALAQQAEPLNLSDPAVRKRLASQWGYVPAAQAEPVEPVAWKQGSLVTFNEDPYPALGGLFVQLWDGEEVAARVYANDLKTLRQRCAKVNTAPPQREPLTEEEILKAIGWERAEMYMKLATNFPVDEAKQETLKNARAVERAVWEKNNG